MFLYVFAVGEVNVFILLFIFPQPVSALGCLLVGMCYISLQQGICYLFLYINVHIYVREMHFYIYVNVYFPFIVCVFAYC